MQRFNSKALLLNGAVGAVVATGLGGLVLANDDVPGVAVLVPVLGAVLYVLWSMRRYIRRMMADPEPPEGIRKTLETGVHFYKCIKDPAEKTRFRHDVQYFLLDQTIVGVGVEVTDELRALVAASAVVLSFGRPWYEWDTTRDILLYPSAFDEDYNHRSDGRRLGQVGSQGPVIFSAKALRAGFASGTDGHNVGFHEFAHVLDFDDGQIDGIPANLNWEAIRPWVDQMSAHFTRRDRQGRRKQVLRDYAFTNEAEFLACATEMFFEQPRRMKQKAPELYRLLEEFYGQPLADQ